MANKPKELRHGMSHTPEWEAWRSMLKRCYKPNTRNFDRYGGRGITVCDRWRESFANFFADMGLRPSDRHSLHRKNNDGNYEPANCEWALPKVQCRNRSRPRRDVPRRPPLLAGLHPRNYRDLTDQTFGRWTVVSRHGSTPDRAGKAVWLCRCVCGTERPVVGQHLLTGRSSSCGCYHKEVVARVSAPAAKKANTTHGMSKTREYASWNQMLQRCLNPKNPTYERYGAKGVTVCGRWQGPVGFANFLSDMGPCPSSEHTIDRIESAKGYEPGNCRWLHRSLQSANRKHVRRYDARGESLTVPEIAQKYGQKAMTVRARIKLGWDMERIITTDPREYHRGKGT